MSDEKKRIAKEIDDWLKLKGHDREWLAKQLNFSIGAIYNSFSKGFSKRTLAAVHKLMNPPGLEDGGLEVKFTEAEFDRIEQARKLLGITTRKLFYEEAIIEYTDEILKREGQQTQPAQNITYHPNSLAKVAEEAANSDSSTPADKGRHRRRLLQSSWQTTDVGDALKGEWSDADGVALVAAEAPHAVAIEVMEEADVIAAWTAHDDGVAWLPVLRALEADRLAPRGPGRSAEVFRRTTRGRLMADVATEAATPGGLAVIAVEPVGGLLDPRGDLRIRFRSGDFTSADVSEGGGEDAGAGGHAR